MRFPPFVQPEHQKIKIKNKLQLHNLNVCLCLSAVDMYVCVYPTLPYIYLLCTLYSAYTYI